MNTTHTHPKNPVEKIFGYILQIGEVRQKGDVYDSPTGKWASIPTSLVGTAVKKGDKRTFIRPVK